VIRYMRIVLVAIIVVQVCTSCSRVPLKETEQVTVRILGISQEMFDADYGNPIAHNGHEITVEAIAIPFVDGEDLHVTTMNRLESDNPDVLVTNGMVLPMLTREGLLHPLDQQVAVNGDRIEGFAPSIMQKIKNDGGDGYIYGLPTTFSSQALFYNQNVFEKYNMPLPTNDMTWTEVLTLEHRLLKTMIESGEAAYGLLEFDVGDAARRLDQLIHAYAMSEGLNGLDASNKKIDMDNTRWRGIWQEMIQAYNEYRLLIDSSRTQFPYEDRLLSFASQRAPLMLGDVSNWHDWSSEVGQLSFQWGVAAPPGRTNIYIQNEVAAIPESSLNKEAAWSLIEYMTSSDVTEANLSAEGNGGFPKGYALPAWITLKEQKVNKDLSAFYVKEPSMVGLYSTSDEFPAQFYSSYRESRIEHIQAVLDGKWTVDAALMDLQKEAQRILDHYLH
jgi:multiple sugar transport system substrate-binding protein